MTTKTFASYKHEVRPLVAYDSVIDSKTKLPKPLKSMDDVSLYEVLDAITLMMQAGKVNVHGWPQQFFANRKAFDEFLEQLSEYDDCFRITDEWWMALSMLAYGNNGGGDEEGFITTADMAQAIANKVEEDGLLVNFGKKAPVYKYSPQECEEADYKYTVAYKSHSYPLMDATVAERAEQHKMADISSFGHCYFGTKLTPERLAQAFAEAKAILKAKKPAKAKAKAKK